MNLSYKEFVSLLDQNLGKRRAPLDGGIELTERCNLNCVHCFINRPAKDKKAIAEEMATEEVFKLIDSAVDNECLWFLMTGGEPLLRTDFKDIYLHAKKRGLLITIFTNATLINDAYASFFKEFPPDSIEISIYGATPKTHDRVTRVPGSFDSCMNGMKSLKKAQVPFELKTMAMTINKHELTDMERLAEKLGVRFRYDPLIQSRYDRGKGPQAYRLTPEEIIDLDRRHEKIRASIRQLCEKLLVPPENDKILGCGAGEYGFFVDPYGNLMPCLGLRKMSYNLRKGTFEDGFYNYFAKITQRRQTKRTECTDCKLRNLCFQCPAWSQTEHGDDETPVDYLCELTHLREKYFNSGGKYHEK